jgi:surfactin synthase thioesterase subunit
MDSTRPALRLFVMHHAGGSHLLYRTWLLDAPGHGLLLDQPQIPDAGALADHLLRGIEPHLTGPYALFGHSMGALVTYEMTRRIVDRGLPLPVWLGLSARTAPQPDRPVAAYREPSDEELRTRLRLLGGTPDGIFADPELWALFDPIIRADLRLVDTWRPVPGAAPLPVALSAYAGREDHSAPPPRMTGWAEHTERFLGLRVFDGGHFHFQDDPGPLLRQIERDATTALDAAGAARSA